MPLHLACCYKAPVGVVDALLQAWPEAAEVKNNFGMPLHCACSNGAPVGVVDVLLQAWPGATVVKEYSGCTPLHYACCHACYHGAPVEEVAALLQAWPAAIKEKDDDDVTPLHTACDYGVPVEVLATLLQAWPEAVKEKDDDGHMPLHYASCSRPPVEVVASLLQAWPEAVIEKANNGSTPLYYACIYGASFEVVKLLLSSWLSHKENTTNEAVLSLPEDLEEEEEDVKVLLSHLFHLCSSNAHTHSPKDIMDYFISIHLWNGAMLVLDRHPTIIKTMDLDTKLMADLLSLLGWGFSLIRMWEVICNEQDLLEGI
eukprot:15355070-Ditylum_brightwellii.AAC.1